MSEFLSNFHFIRPLVLLLLVLPLWYVWRYARSRGRDSSWAQVCDKICWISCWLKEVLYNGN